MANIRKINQILSEKEKFYLQGRIETLYENKTVLEKDPNFTEKQIKDIVNFLEDYVQYDVVVDSLELAHQEVKEKRYQAKIKYESASNRKEADKYLDEWIDLTKKMKNLKAEFEHYEKIRVSKEDKMLEYDGMVCDALERAKNREKGRDDNTPARPNNNRKR